MSELNPVFISLEELCHATQLPWKIIEKMIEQGIVEVQGDAPDNWRVSVHTIALTKRALRLHHDLGIDWAGLGLVLPLITEVEQLRDENQRLRRQLGRFLSPL